MPDTAFRLGLYGNSGGKTPYYLLSGIIPWHCRKRFFGWKTCAHVSCSQYIRRSRGCFLRLFLYYNRILCTLPFRFFAHMDAAAGYIKTLRISSHIGIYEESSLPPAYLYFWPHRTLYCNRILRIAYHHRAMQQFRLTSFFYDQIHSLYQLVDFNRYLHYSKIKGNHKKTAVCWKMKCGKKAYSNSGTGSI